MNVKGKRKWKKKEMKEKYKAKEERRKKQISKN